MRTCFALAAAIASCAPVAPPSRRGADAPASTRALIASPAPVEAAPSPVEAPPSAIELAASNLDSVPDRLGELRLLSGDSTGHFAIAPDSAWVVFLAKQAGLIAVRPDGTDRHTLAGRDAGATFFRITPDARHVVYAAQSRLFVIPIGGGEAKAITDSLPSIGNLEVSNDSQWIFYGPIGGGVMRARLDGSDSDTLLDRHPLGAIYRITEDSKRVVHRGRERVLSQALDGSDVVDLTPNLERADLHFLVVGGAIVGEERTIYFAPFDGSGAIALASELWPYTWPPQPAAGGVAIHDGAFNLHHVDPRTRTTTRVNRPLDEAEQVSPFLASTDREIVYTIFTGHGAARRQEIRVAELASGRDRAVAIADQAATLVLKTTGDGRAIAHVERGRGAQAFFAIDLATDAVARLTSDLPGWGNFYLAPDGRYLVFGWPKLYVLELPR